MTNALDDFKYLNRWFSIERTYRPKYERIVEALTLATESEQLRKERDEYKHKYELTRAGCKNTDIKGNENGNA